MMTKAPTQRSRKSLYSRHRSGSKVVFLSRTLIAAILAREAASANRGTSKRCSIALVALSEWICTGALLVLVSKSLKVLVHHPVLILG